MSFSVSREPGSSSGRQNHVINLVPIDTRGVPGLRVTRLQIYRDNPPSRRRSAGSSRALRKSRSAAEEPMVCGLSAGGNRIRTIGPALVKGLWAVADERCRTDKLDGVIKHRSSRETTMVGRGASLDVRLFFGGTDGSNPVPSIGESGELPTKLGPNLRGR